MYRSTFYFSIAAALLASASACSGNQIGSGGSTASDTTAGSTTGAATAGTTTGGTTAGTTTGGTTTAGANTAGANTAGANTAGANTAGANTTGATMGTTMPGTTAGGGTTGATTAGNANGPPTLSTTPMPGQSTNPFIGAVMYVNPDYTAEVTAASAMAKAADAPGMAQMGAQPTAVWLDRIAAIAGGPANSNRLSLTAHLDAALQQASDANKPGLVVLVIYDLPDRDCKSSASNGELQGTAGLATYKAQYIDAIAAALTSKPAYASLRIVTVIEPDSIPNLVTNQSVPACATALQTGVYIDGVTYAIQKLSALSNVYLYMDIAHAGWLGWPSQMAAAVQQYTSLINTATNNKPSLIRGFATDIANYTPVQEPFLNPNNQSVLSDNFYQYNPCFDEVTFVRNLAAGFKGAGLTNIGFITDTSRTGWNPVNNGQPIDRRKARGDWCNVSGAGVGELPQATPAVDPLIDAFVWVKPPGESDGISASENPTNAPDAQGKRFDPFCDPNDTTKEAMPGAPAAGDWFQAEFTSLVENAHPVLK